LVPKGQQKLDIQWVLLFRMERYPGHHDSLTGWVLHKGGGTAGMVMHELQALGIWEIGMCFPLLGHGNQYSVLAITVENPRSTKEKKQVKQPARSTCT
jgi:hypothetical protein